jgi:hypothetical protein
MSYARVVRTLAAPLRIVSRGGACAVIACSALNAAAQSQPPSAAARALVEATPTAEREALLQPFTDDARSDWHYTPRRRAGVAWRHMNARQREATTALLRTALGAAGLDKVRAVMALEVALRELETFGFSRDPENYAVALFGQPGDPAWGWRLEGHHLSLHWTLRGDAYVATLPQFFGANPADVPRHIGATGPRKGTRVLAAEEDRARALLDSLAPAQRSVARFDTRPYGDIVTRNARRANPPEPVGIPFVDLSPQQQALLLSLVGAFAEHLRPDLAQQRLARVRAGGLDTIRFGWAGSAVPGEAHYFRIQGAGFLIEFDNSGGNHIHCVWRDFAGDWGRDVLGDHYRSASADGGAHRHGTR